METLALLDDDVLVQILSFLPPDDILNVRLISRRFFSTSKLHIVWSNACEAHILRHGYPFPRYLLPLPKIPTPVLERLTVRAYRLAHKWTSAISSTPRTVIKVNVVSGISVSDVRLLPQSWLPRDDDFCCRILTVSKGIWDVLTMWDIYYTRSASRRGEWSPRGAIFTSLCLNSDKSLDETIMAISATKDDVHSVLVLSATENNQNDQITFSVLWSINSSARPVYLCQDLLSVSDDLTRNIDIYNWKSNKHLAILQDKSDEDDSDASGVFQRDVCLQVLFSYNSVLAVRARSVLLFPQPDFDASSPNVRPQVLGPIASHSFGWVDSASASLSPSPSFTSREFTRSPVREESHSPLMILVRGECDDPWSSTSNTLDLYTADPVFGFKVDPYGDDAGNGHSNGSGASGSHPQVSMLPSPYLFPPIPRAQIPARRGPLRCKDVILGPCGTAIWIEPKDRYSTGLVSSGLGFDAPSGHEGLGLLAEDGFMQTPRAFCRSSVSQVQPGSRTGSLRETLVAAALSGPFASVEKRSIQRQDFAHSGQQSKPLLVNDQLNQDWAFFDYDEDTGRIVVASGFGTVTVLEI